MPGGGITLTAEFFEAEAKLELGGNIRYYETLEAAFGAVNSGEEAAITLLKNVNVYSNIPVTGNVKLVAADGPVKTVKRGSGTESLFTVSGAGASLELDAGFSLGLTVDGGKESGKTATDALVRVSGGTLRMGGDVTLQNNRNVNANAYGGGVHVDSGTFIMEKGGIQDNEAQHGSGVYISSGSFEMIGGSINGNTAAANTSGHAYGGGVYIGNSGTFAMKGGEISGNTVSGTSAYGGGVYIGNSGTFAMEGGEIGGNTVNNKSNGVYVNGSFKMSGKSVVKQEVHLTSGKQISVSGALDPPAGETYSAEIKPAGTVDGTVVVQGTDGYPLKFDDLAKFKLSPPHSEEFLIYNNNQGVFAQPEASDTALYFGSDNTLHHSSTLADAINNVPSGTAAAPAVISITKDLTQLASSDNINLTSGKHIKLTVGDGGDKAIERVSGNSGSLFTIQPGASLTLDAGNGSLTLDGKNITANAPLVTVSGGKLTMGDGVTLKGSKKPNQYSDSCGIRVYNGGTFTMTGGTISGNKMSSHYGGGVHVDGNSRFEMSGGTISGNEAGSAGGVTVTGGSTFEMTGGVISNNNALDGNGGGVFVGGNNSRFTMTGGTISGNTAYLNGGGVFRDGGTFTMEGGEISGNTVTDATGSGGGVYSSGTSGTFTMSGGTINGNTGSSPNIAPNGAAFYKAGGTVNPSSLGTTNNTIVNGAVQ
jgi:hypothetical protein